MKKNTPFGMSETDLEHLDHSLQNLIAEVWDSKDRYALDEENRAELIELAVNSEEWVESVRGVMRPTLESRSAIGMLSIVNELMDYLEEFEMKWENKSLDDVGILMAYVYVTRYMGIITEDKLLECLDHVDQNCSIN